MISVPKIVNGGISAPASPKSQGVLLDASTYSNYLKFYRANDSCHDVDCAGRWYNGTRQRQLHWGAGGQPKHHPKPFGQRATSGLHVARRQLGADRPRYCGFYNAYLHDRRSGTTTSLNVGSHGQFGNGFSLYAFLSQNGCCAIFSSAADNLIANDTNGVVDTFLRNLETGRVTRVSVGTRGAQGDSASSPARNGINVTGRFIVFASNSSTIVPSTGSGHANIFVRDVKKGITTVETVGPNGEPGNTTPIPRSSR